MVVPALPEADSYCGHGEEAVELSGLSPKADGGKEYCKLGRVRWERIQDDLAIMAADTIGLPLHMGGSAVRALPIIDPDKAGFWERWWRRGVVGCFIGCLLLPLLSQEAPPLGRLRHVLERQGRRKGEVKREDGGLLCVLLVGGQERRGNVSELFFQCGGITGSWIPALLCGGGSCSHGNKRGGEGPYTI